MYSKKQHINTQKTRKSRLKNGILNYFPGFIKHHFHLKVNLYLIKQSFYSRLINKFKTVRSNCVDVKRNFQPKAYYFLPLSLE